MTSKDKWVRRFSIDDTAKHKNGFTIYKITSVLFPLQSPEAVTVVAVWKRYSDIQQLHKAMKALHAGLHLRGKFPELVKGNYFKRFDSEVIEERAMTIKNVLEFVAEHRLLFTSTDFVNFLQSGYPDPATQKAPSSVIDAIRSTLRLPAEVVPSVVHESLDDITSQDTTDHTNSHPLNFVAQSSQPPERITTIDNEISKIPIYLPFDVEFKKEQKKLHRKMPSDESLASIESLKDELFDDINKIRVEKPEKSIKKIILPDLINFDQPSTSRFDDIHTTEIDRNRKIDSESVISDLESKTNDPEFKTTDTEFKTIDTEFKPTDSEFKTTDTEFKTTDRSIYETDSNKSETIRRSESRISLHSKQSVFSLSELDAKSRTESSYIFEAGHLLNLAARSEEGGLYEKAFDLYKAGIEILLIGVKDDPDAQRKALVKVKINKYLCYAEAIYKQHLTNVDSDLLKFPPCRPARSGRPFPARGETELHRVRLLSLLAGSVMLVYSEEMGSSAALKVIQKIPNNLTDFDDNYVATVNETKTPILPSNVPYMVALHFYIEMKNLYFLILSYAPGDRLFDYIRNYSNAIRNTKDRKSNLENVFVEPKPSPKVFKENFKETNKNNNDKSIKYYNSSENENINLESDIDTVKDDIKTDTDLSVNDLVMNSQRLLQNVDKALKDSRHIDVVNRNDEDKGETDTLKSDIDTFIDDNDINNENVQIKIVDKKCEVQNVVKKSPVLNKRIVSSRDVLPPSTISKWGAEILTALEALHHCGVVCRDLNPNNILLSANGQITLTYFLGYNEWELTLCQIEKQMPPHGVNLYIAPELYEVTFADEERRPDDHLCDYWSFGAIMFELICGLPLSYFHNSVFTSHTILQTPDGLDYEALSLLTQLLTYSPRSRLGANGIHEIKLHPYFKHIDWRQIYHDWTPPT